MPPVCLYSSCTFICLLGCRHSHMFPILPCASVCSQRLLHVVGGCNGLLTCWTPPYTSPVWGCLPMSYTPNLLVGFPVHLYILGISAYDMGNISLMLGVWKVFPNLLGFLGASAHGVSICFFLHILIVHYVSHFYYGYDYYSSNYGSVFWAVICFISYHSSFSDGASCNIGSV